MNMIKRLGDLWTRARRRIRERVGARLYDLWFGPVDLVHMSGGQAVLEVPNRFFREWIEDNYPQLIPDVLQEVSGEALEVKYEQGGESTVRCTSCGSEAVYRYGKAWTGKQRFLCLICGKQFTLGAERARVSGRPYCPSCGQLMHLYKREEGAIRFRCSKYPACKTFKKITIKKEEELK